MSEFFRRSDGVMVFVGTFEQRAIDLLVQLESTHDGRKGSYDAKTRTLIIDAPRAGERETRKYYGSFDTALRDLPPGVTIPLSPTIQIGNTYAPPPKTGTFELFWKDGVSLGTMFEAPVDAPDAELIRLAIKADHAQRGHNMSKVVRYKIKKPDGKFTDAFYGERQGEARGSEEPPVVLTALFGNGSQFSSPAGVGSLGERHVSFTVTAGATDEELKKAGEAAYKKQFEKPNSAYYDALPMKGCRYFVKRPNGSVFDYIF